MPVFPAAFGYAYSTPRYVYHCAVTRYDYAGTMQARWLANAYQPVENIEEIPGFQVDGHNVVAYLGGDGDVNPYGGAGWFDSAGSVESTDSASEAVYNHAFDVMTGGKYCGIFWLANASFTYARHFSLWDGSAYYDGTRCVGVNPLPSTATPTGYPSKYLIAGDGGQYVFDVWQILDGTDPTHAYRINYNKPASNMATAHLAANRSGVFPGYDINSDGTILSILYGTLQPGQLTVRAWVVPYDTATGYTYAPQVELVGTPSPGTGYLYYPGIVRVASDGTFFVAWERYRGGSVASTYDILHYAADGNYIGVHSSNWNDTIDFRLDRESELVYVREYRRTPFVPFPYAKTQLSAPVDKRFGIHHCAVASDNVIYHRRSLVGQAWGAATEVGAGYNPTMVILPDGTLDIRGDDPEGGEVHYTSKDAGETW